MLFQIYLICFHMFVIYLAAAGCTTAIIKKIEPSSCHSVLRDTSHQGPLQRQLITSPQPSLIQSYQEETKDRKIYFQ